jgi:hypothetical protein
MADTRYLKQRRQGWYFQLKVPSDVAPRWKGTNPVVVSLKTRDLSKAQVDRWLLVTHYVSHFEVLPVQPSIQSFGESVQPLQVCAQLLHHTYPLSSMLALKIPRTVVLLSAD